MTRRLKLLLLPLLKLLLLPHLHLLLKHLLLLPLTLPPLVLLLAPPLVLLLLAPLTLLLVLLKRPLALLMLLLVPLTRLLTLPRLLLTLLPALLPSNSLLMQARGFGLLQKKPHQGAVFLCLPIWPVDDVAEACVQAASVRVLASFASLNARQMRGP